MEKIPIGIIGLGMVGGAYARWFESRGHPVLPYDPPKGIGSRDSVNGANLILIAVPTPFDEKSGRFDGSLVEEAISALTGSKIVVIKSTVLPGTTKRLQAQYPQHRLLFCPEFLTESRAAEDVARPAVSIVGYTTASQAVAPDVMALFAPAPFERMMPASEAEFFKYLRNAFFATKVIFFNQLYDLSTRLNLDYEVIRECAANDPWIAGHHMEVWHRGYRGYGGKCLPKDTRAFMAFSAQEGVRLELLETVERINQILQISTSTPAEQVRLSAERGASSAHSAAEASESSSAL
mgnify:CR=1 FL=1